MNEKKNAIQRKNYRKNIEKRRKYSREYARKYKLTHPEYYNRALLKNRERVRTKRLIVMDHYGGKCVCCGENIIEFLTIDHINNDGYVHRKIIGKCSLILYNWIIKNNFPKDLQILCYNCNMAKGRYGVCPHQRSGKL